MSRQSAETQEKEVQSAQFEEFTRYDLIAQIARSIESKESEFEDEQEMMWGSDDTDVDVSSYFMID